MNRSCFFPLVLSFFLFRFLHILIDDGRHKIWFHLFSIHYCIWVVWTYVVGYICGLNSHHSLLYHSFMSVHASSQVSLHIPVISVQFSVFQVLTSLFLM
jgi:hypothetical protein